MKSQLVKKLLAGSLATALTISLMACGGSAPAANEAAETPADTTEVAAEAPAEDTAAAEPEEEESLYTVLTDEDGNVYDLGGMEIIVRDWWSGDPAEPTNDYEGQEKNIVTGFRKPITSLLRNRLFQTGPLHLQTLRNMQQPVEMKTTFS